MKNISTFFLKAVIILFGIAVFSGLLYFPTTEGRAANLDLVSIYKDPLILYVYLGSIPFFVGLYQAFKLLSLIDANKAFTQNAVNTLKNMRFAAFSLIGFIIPALIFIRFFANGDDPAGPIGLGITVSFALFVTAVATSIFEKILQNGIKSIS